MKAAVCIKHGGPEGVKILEVDYPSTRKDEILVRVKATTVISGDVALRKQSFLQFFLSWPLARLMFGVKNQRKRILGHEFSGIVEEIGEDVKKFKVGDAVFGTTGFKGGAHAELITLSEDSIIEKKPAGISFEEASALPIGGICALHLLRKANITENDKVLIYGASGSIGTYAVQLAKHFGASVTAVCSSANTELVKSLGADNVLDYKKDDITKVGDKYDIVFDTVGKFSKIKAKSILAQNGRYISTHSSPVKEKHDYLELIKKLAINGEIKAVIDRTYCLDEIQKAHAYVETGRKRGNVVITFN